MGRVALARGTRRVPSKVPESACTASNRLLGTLAYPTVGAALTTHPGASRQTIPVGTRERV